MRDHPFFKDTPRKTLDIEGEPIEFPIFYYDVRLIAAAFTVKVSELKRLLPHPKLKPIKIWPGTGMLEIAAFEYRDTSIGPYNEIGIAIPVKFPPGLIFPGLSAMKMMRNNRFSVYVHHLPVTTEIALKLGVHFYNYPKFLADITFQDMDNNLEVTLREGDDLILKMRAKKLPAKRSRGFEIHTYSIKKDAIMHSLVEGWAPQLGSVMMGSVAELELGEHRISKELADLNLSRTARSGLYGEAAMTKLYHPDTRWCGDTLEVLSRSKGEFV
jgi:hypothetical protein